MQKNLALVAHDHKKPDLIRWAQAHKEILAKHHLVATGTTGGLLADALALPVFRYKSGPLGGDQQIGALIAEGKLDALLHAACPVEADRATLLRSHFWVAGGPGYAAQWLAGPGLPDAAALGWLLGGMAAEPANAVEDDGAAGNDATEAESR